MKYRLDIDLNVLNHLGLNLYSNVPAVLSELIANAWDADAGEVTIDVADDKKSITIQDDGCGMSPDDLNEKFLTVGYERRKESGGITKGKKRCVMGRKGIGKLSVFSIAENVRVITKTSGTKPVGIELNTKDIQKAIKRKDPYHPKEIKPQKLEKITADSGTTIILSKLRKRISNSLTKNLKKRVARRFDIIGNGFVVKVNKEKVDSKDKWYMGKLICVFIYGDCDKGQFSDISNKRIKKRKNSIQVGGSSCTVTGWIGAVKEHKDLQDGASNLNKIAIFCWGKMALEDISASYAEGRVGRKYIRGEIRADFMDETNQEDITTSSRQDFAQDDERFVELKKFIEKEQKAVISKWVSIKEEEGEEKAKEIPQVREWFETLKGKSKKTARTLFGKINRIATEESQKTLLKHGILAFEYMNHRDRLNQLNDMSEGGVEELVKVFTSLDDIEAGWYYEITRGRLRVIDTLNKMQEDNRLERIIQRHVHDHLWLLDPSWDRATERPSMERGVKKAFEKVSSKLTEEERKARIDILYRKTTGKHIIIELKRPRSRPSVGQLIDQLDKYKRALSKQLEASGPSGPIEIICLMGSEGLSGWEDRVKKQDDEKTLEQGSIRVVTYQKLIHDAEKSYQEYLDENKDKLGKLKEVMIALDD